MHRLIGIALLLLTALQAMAVEVPDTAVVVAGYASRNEVEARLRSRVGDNIEGLWRYPEEGLVIAIEKTSGSDYRMVVVESDNECVDRGTVMGYLTTTAKASKLRMWLYSAIDSDMLTMPEKCIAEYSDGTILIKHKALKAQLSVNLIRFLPTVFSGIRVYPHIERPTAEPGLHKIDLTNNAAGQLIF